MVSEFLLNIVFSLVSGMLSAMPDISWSTDTTAFNYFLDVVRVAGYMFPFDTVFYIVSCVVSFTIVRIMIAIPKAIWDLLPLA